VLTVLVLLLLLLAAAAGALWLLNIRDEAPIAADARPTEGTAAQIARGAYLATAGHCAGCHTAPGGPAYAGGVALPTPFGTLYSSNLTADDDTGLGTWSSSHFWRAMHNGRSKDGRLLYPGFPYTSFTHVTREDSDALYHYLRSLPAVAQRNRAHDLRFPYSNPLALAAWRALFFHPDADTEAPRGEPTPLARGAYLVNGLGHCAACHSPRNALGAASGGQDLRGGDLPAQAWYAPSLHAPEEAGVQNWSEDEVVALLRDGINTRASVTGPMADVVHGSTSRLLEADLRAMATWLRQLPVAAPARAGDDTPASADLLALGADVYRQHCAACHGDQGEGRAGAWPALAGNRAVTMATWTNLVRTVLAGGFPPTTKGNPRPYGMPPYAQTLSDAQIAAVVSYIRQSWGNAAGGVRPVDVVTLRQQMTH